MPYHVVRQGEHLELIAYRRGVSADEVWEADQNARLRELRGSGHVLAPGDVLWVPRGRAPEPISLSVGSSNQLTAQVPRTRVSLTLGDGAGPLRNEPFEVPEAPSLSGQSDGDGKVDLDVPLTLRRFRLHLTRMNVVLPLAVGELDPLHEITGIQQRLLQLGHYSGPVDGRLGDATMAGIRSFQRASGAAPSGMPDAATLDALREAYGS